MRDEVDGDDDIVFDSGKVFWVGIGDEDAVSGAIPEGFAAVLLHHHVIRKADEAALGEEGFDVFLGGAASVNFGLGGDDGRNSTRLNALKGDGISEDYILCTETQQVFARNGMTQRQLVATVVVLLIHDETKTILIREFDDMCATILMPHIVFALRSDLKARNDVVGGKLPQDGYLLIE